MGGYDSACHWPLAQHINEFGNVITFGEEPMRHFGHVCKCTWGAADVHSLFLMRGVSSNAKVADG
jgi:hypothetical protein